MPQVPFSFELKENSVVSDLLSKTISNGIITLNWKEINVSIYFKDLKENEYYPRLDNIKKHTPDFHFYEKFGFTINKYSEFLIYAEAWEYAPFVCLKENNGVEISIGSLTPIGHFIFDIYHENDYHPELESCLSIRVLGADFTEVETCLLNALNKIIYEYNTSFNFFSLESFDFDEISDYEKTDIAEELHYIRNNELIPNRLFYKGLKESDSSNAFLDFYRVLEYYSIIMLENDVNKIRIDSAISKRDFVLKMNRIINDNERALLGKLVNRIADAKILSYCEKNKLISSPKPEILCNELYEFRNSLVHSKLNQTNMPFSKSILKQDDETMKWNFVCKELAYNCMTKI